MAIAYVDFNTGTNSIGLMPDYVIGDMLIVFAFRDGSTIAPSLPPGWTSAGTRTGTTCSMRVGYRVATSDSMTSGTWTNATSVIMLAYRGVASTGGVLTPTFGSGSSTTISYPAITVAGDNPDGWVVRFAAHRSVNTALELPPAGMVFRAGVVDATDEAAAFDSNGPTASIGVTTVSVGGTSSGWVAASVCLVPEVEIHTSGSMATVVLETQAAIELEPYREAGGYATIYVGAATGVLPILEGYTQTGHAYAVAGYNVFGYAENDIPVLSTYATYSTPASTTPRSDRAVAAPVAHATLLPVSDRSGVAYSRISASTPYSSAIPYAPYRRVYSVGHAGVYASPGVTPSEGYQPQYLGTTASPVPVIPHIVLPASAPMPMPMVSSEYSVLYGNSTVCAVFIFPQDVATSYPYFLEGKHDVIANVPLVLWTLDQQYALQSDGAQLYEWSLESIYTLIDYIPEWQVDNEYSLLAFQEYQWSLDSEWAMGKEEWGIDSVHAIVGAQILYDFQAELNSLRASLALPPIAVCTQPIHDIAQQHSVHMRQAGIMAHDSNVFPVTWRTLEERIAIHVSPSISGLENLLAVWEDLSTGTVLGSELYTRWFNSPPHYANMIESWPEGADLQFLLGVEYFLTEFTADDVLYVASPGTYYAIATLVILNFTPEVELVPVEFSLSSNYSLYTAILERIDAEWDTRAYSLVQRRQSSPYSLRVAAQHSVPYNAWVSAAHSAPIHYTVHGLHETGYASTISVFSQHTTEYKVDQYALVGAAHTAGWASSMEVGFSMQYADAAAVLAANSIDYGDKPLVLTGHLSMYSETPVVLQQLASMYGDSNTVAAAHVTGYSVKAQVGTQHKTAYADQVLVRTQHSADYQLAINSFVATQHKLFYALVDSGVLSLSASVSVQHEGIEIDCNNLVLEIDEGDVAWSASIGITSTEQFALIQHGDPLTVSLQGTTFNLVVDTKNISRSGPASVDMGVTAVSPVLLLDSPVTATVTYVQVEAISAHALVNQLLSQVVAWAIHDWVIPPYRFAVSDVSPLAAAKLIAEAAGAYITSLPDGSLRVQYRYPYATNTYAAQPVAHTFTDVEDNISYSGKSTVADGYNAYRVKDTSGYTSDILEWVLDEGSLDQGTLRAYLLPWRPVSVTVNTTNTGPIALVPMGIESYTHSEIVQLVNGSASLEKPAVAIVSVEWMSTELPGLYLEARTRDVKAGVDTNYGYGLAKITYTVECMKYRVSGVVGTSAQFIIVDSGV